MHVLVRGHVPYHVRARVRGRIHGHDSQESRGLRDPVRGPDRGDTLQRGAELAQK